jgi:hypothetical protein
MGPLEERQVAAAGEQKEGLLEFRETEAEVRGGLVVCVRECPVGLCCRGPCLLC